MNTDLSVLNNFGVPPKSVIKYDGLNQGGLSDLALHRIPGGSGVTGIGFHGNNKAYGRGLFGTRVVFRLDPSWIGLSPQAILEKLGVQIESSDEAPIKLTKIINDQANRLPLPEGCAVVNPENNHRVIWNDALSTLVIITKCTQTVWLRSKNPSLVIGEDKLAVSLLIPPLFEASLPEQP